jgi:hypothetical protein
MDYEIFSHNSIIHILYISYHGIMCFRYNTRALIYIYIYIYIYIIVGCLCVATAYNNTYVNYL